MPEPNDVALLDEHTLLRWGSKNAAMEMQHLIRNVCKSSLDESELDVLHGSAITHWEQQNDALASILELHHRIQRGETDVSNHLSSRANGLMSSYSGAFATLLDEALVSNSEDIDLIELAAQHALNRAEIDVAKAYIQGQNSPKLANIRMQIAQFEGKKDPLQDLETILAELHDGQQKLRIQLSVLSRCIDDLTPFSSAHDHERIERWLNQVELPDAEHERQIVLTTLVIMRHSLALERKDFDGANFLLDQLRGVGSSTDPLLQYLGMKTELKAVDSNPMDAALTLRNAELLQRSWSSPCTKRHFCFSFASNWRKHNYPEQRPSMHKSTSTRSKRLKHHQQGESLQSGGK